MKRERILFRFTLLALLWSGMTVAVVAQNTSTGDDDQFGPVVRAYLGYLRDEQQVVDDRASRHEISTRFYRRNSNRIRALREKAISIVRETGNDYLPELEAAARDELGTLFETPPHPRRLRVGEVLNNTFRFLGTVRAGEVFYIFSRLDPYEQQELLEKEKRNASTLEPPPSTQTPIGPSTKANSP